MEKLLNLLKDGHARTTVMLAAELDTTPADIRRKLEFMENMGIIKRVSMTVTSCGSGSCGSCSGCSPDHSGGNNGCAGCIPGAEMLNMGEMWEVVK